METLDFPTHSYLKTCVWMSLFFKYAAFNAWIWYSENLGDHAVDQDDYRIKYSYFGITMVRCLQSCCIESKFNIQLNVKIFHCVRQIQIQNVKIQLYVETLQPKKSTVLAIPFAQLVMLIIRTILGPRLRPCLSLKISLLKI